ncbi:MAG: hypothetical protein H7318_16530 [Oligoflexus sp.]|nr:hypothetical protein [Oligoflexus sp.]
MKHIAITLALVVFSAFAFAHEGHEHPETTPPAASTNHTPVVNADHHESEAQDNGSDDVVAEGSEYSEFAAHMIFEVRVEDQELDPYAMAIARTNADLPIVALEDSKLMLLGGKPLGKRYI